MNLLLLTPEDIIDEQHACIPNDRRLTHIHKIHQSKVGDTIKVGVLNGAMGIGYITTLNNTEAHITFSLNTPPPPKIPVTLILALPRPKMLRRILQTITTLGIPKLILINSYKVEKSFWQTPFLAPSYMEEQLKLGLEQAKDTVLPTIQLETRFKPFVEDTLPALMQNTKGFIAHLGNYPPCPHYPNQPVTLAIGPEGGWIPYEVEKLQMAGLIPIQLGQRILQVETAIVSVLTRISYPSL